MEDFSFKMLRMSGMQCNDCYGSEQGLVPRKTILDKNGWSMTLLQAKAKRNARFSCYSLRLCTMPEGTPPPRPSPLSLWQKWGKWTNDHQGSQRSETRSSCQSSCSFCLPPLSLATCSCTHFKTAGGEHGLEPWLSCFGRSRYLASLCLVSSSVQWGCWHCLPRRPPWARKKRLPGA